MTFKDRDRESGEVKIERRRCYLEKMKLANSNVPPLDVHMSKATF